MKSAKSGRTKRGVLAGCADSGTELSTSLPNRPMSTKQGLGKTARYKSVLTVAILYHSIIFVEKNAGTSGPIKSGFDYESFSDKEADTDTTGK